MSSATTYVCRQFVEDVTAYLDGALPEQVLRLVEQHLADCPHCREYLSEMRATIAMTGVVSESDVEAMPADVRQRLMQAFLEREG